MLGCTVPLLALSLSHTRSPASVRVNKNPKKQKPHHTDRHARTKAHTHTYTATRNFFPLLLLLLWVVTESFRFFSLFNLVFVALVQSSYSGTAFHLTLQTLCVCLEVFVCVLGVCVLMCCISKRGTGRKRVALFHPCTKHTHTTATHMHDHFIFF